LAELSARELCSLAGVTVSVAAMIERGHIHRPAADILAALACVLGISLDWLILGKGEAPSGARVKAAVEAARRTPEAPALAATGS